MNKTAALFQPALGDVTITAQVIAVERQDDVLGIIKIWTVDGQTMENVGVKCKVYKGIVISTVVHGDERWTVYKSQVKKLHVFSMINS